ncbi:hypothetical protein [Amycolatopsis sp. BJA-103]|uniref:hypothetical protein n=1 Tax=unclassified Amycolatopsis TaxID=2618356 RepID=UPI000C9BDDDC|nr:hypothetical protein [Amycolatopsis sp. BJA-103]AUI64684.1 hypothetical protein BKN51_25605 [Amycolatopsis sp. BJA-103]PNE22199.1 hypothetical protein B1H26_06860 [Amycolatopsis sp. BJA-103]
MADYDCQPLWDVSAPGDIDPASLPLGGETRERIAAWAGRYDDTLDRDVPQRSGFRTEEAARRWLEDGRLLAERIRRELPGSWSLAYFHEHDRAADLMSGR